MDKNTLNETPIDLALLIPRYKISSKIQDFLRKKLNKKKKANNYSPKIQKSLLARPNSNSRKSSIRENIIRDSILHKVGDFIRSYIFNKASKNL